jgi:hypothetical protein
MNFEGVRNGSAGSFGPKLVYSIEEKRADRALYEKMVFRMDGRLYLIKAKWARVNVLKGILGIATNGRITTLYDHMEKPVETVDEQGSAVQSDFRVSYKLEPVKGQDNLYSIVRTTVVDEAEPLAPYTVHEQTYTYVNDRLTDKTRSNIYNEWIEEAKGLGFIVGGLMLAYLMGTLLIGKIAGWLGGLLRRRESIPAGYSPAQVDQRKIEEINEFDDYGFQQGVVTVVKENIVKPKITSWMQRGENLNEKINEFFANYNNWLKAVMGQEPAGQYELEDIYLYYLVSINAGKMANTTGTFVNYLFYISRQKINGTNPKEIGQEADRETARWDKMILRHDKSDAAKNIISKSAASKRLIQSDIEDYFRSQAFIQWYEEGGKEKIDNYLNDAAEDELLNDFLQKTYHDISGGPHGIKGWLVLFRNMFKAFLPLVVVTTAASVALPIALEAFSFYMWAVLAGGSIGLALTLNYLAGQLIDKKLNKGNWGRWIPEAEEKGIEAPDGTRGRKIRALAMALVVLAQKGVWNYLIFKWISAPLSIVWGATYITAPLNYLLFAGILLPFILFFFVDVFAFFYLSEGLWGYVLAKFRGVNRINKWNSFIGKSVNRSFNQAAQGFKDKILPAFTTDAAGKKVEFSEAQQDIAWAKAWNMIIKQLYEDDLISEREYEDYSYGIETDKKDYLAGKIIEGKGPSLSRAPANERVRRRLQHFLSTLLMDMEKMPVWERLYLFSVITPCYSEVVMYLFSDQSMEEYEAINHKYETGETLLTYVINRYPDEWNNFVNRMEKSGLYSRKDLDRLKSLRFGQILELDSQELKTEVRLWISFRYQPLARTIRGIVNYRKMYEFLAKANYPTAASLGAETEKEYQEKIKKLVDEKFEYIVGHQPYGKAIKKANFKDATAVDDIHFLMKKYGFKIAYLGDPDPKKENETEEDKANKETHHFGALLEYKQGPVEKDETVMHQFTDNNGVVTGRIVRIRKINMPSHYLFAQGKPVNQNNIFRFVRGEITQFMDMNQDMYLEETFKGPCLAEEFRKDPKLVIAGYPEDIITDEATLVGRLHAFADRTFNTTVQRTLNWMGIRFHYGHPDYVRTDLIKQ